MMKELPKRKKNRLESYDYGSEGAYFITVCTKEGKPLFWEKDQPEFVGEDIILPYENVRLSPYGKIVDEAIKAIPLHYPDVKLLLYTVMPNHIHMILHITRADGRMISSPTSVLTVVGQMKRAVSKKAEKPIWQRSFHDHVIRDRSDYEKIAEYIRQNPARWQLDRYYTEV